MDKIRVTGGRQLQGKVTVSGAKNAALPAMAASLLTPETVELENVPCVQDIFTARRLLEAMGVEAEVSPAGIARLRADHELTSREAPYELVKTMRASILVLGPLRGTVRPRAGVAARRLRHRRAADESPPHGTGEDGRPVSTSCMAMSRPSCEALRGRDNHDRHPDRHRHRESDDGGRAWRKGEPCWTTPRASPRSWISPTCCAAWARGSKGDGTRTIRIRGCIPLHGCRHRIIPDRIEAGTFAVAAPSRAATWRSPTAGRITWVRSSPCSSAPAHESRRCGPMPSRVRLRRSPLAGCHHASIPRLSHRYAGAVYGAHDPGGRDLALITETIFENRFMHALELHPHGGRRSDRWPARTWYRRRETHRRPSPGFRPACQRLPDPGRACRRGRNRRRPRLSSGPRLRPDRSKLAGLGADRAPEVIPAFVRRMLHHAYGKIAMKSGCLFCQIIAGERPSRIVYEDDLCVAIEDVHPMLRCTSWLCRASTSRR